jgi:chromosome segregation protein
MEDIIFNGTEKRKRGGVAHVSITFENNKGLIPSEYQTISISRILYRSGESEYRLNDVTCRRKDILNLFIDTGIGSNSYAIIGQGMVTEIINDRDGSRRKMFEQAAGISKYKIRKRETFNKLNATQGDLDRVEDLLFELENSLKDLERQAKRARKHKELKEQYREKSIQLSVLSTNKYKEEYESLKSKILSEKTKLTEWRAKLRTLEANLEEAKRTNVNLEQEVSSSQRVMNELLDGLRQLESAKEIKGQRLEFLQVDLERVKTQIGISKSKQEEIRKELEALDRHRVVVQEDREKAQKESERSNQEYDLLRSKHETARTDLSEFMNQKQGLHNSVFDLEKGYAININKIDGNQLSIEKKELLINNRQLEASQLEQDVKSLSMKKVALTRDIQALLSAENNRQQRLEELEKKSSDLREEIDTKLRLKDKKANEYKLIKGMVDNLEGFPESVRFISQSWQQEKVLFSDIIECKKDYRLAIESYLEPYLNHFVVKNYVEAAEALRFLTSAQKGKAQFFLLDEFGLVKEKSAEIPPNSIPALDVIVNPDRYQPILKTLLHNVFVTDDLTAVELYQGEGALLHIGGGLIRRNQQIKGGSVGLFEGKKLGRKKEMERLEKEVEDLESDLASLEVRQRELTGEFDLLKRADNSTILGEKQKELSAVEHSHVGFATKLEGILNSITLENEACDQLKEESELLIAKNGDISQLLISRKTELEELEAIIASRGGEMDQWVGQLSLASESSNTANRNLMQIQNKEANLVQKIDFLNEQYVANEKMISDGEERIKREENEQHTLKDELSDIENKLLKEYQSKGDYQTKLNDIEKHYYSERNAIQSQEEEVRQVSKNLMGQQDLIEELTQKYSDVRIRLRSITDRLEVEFGVTMEEILAEDVEPNMTFEELTEKVERLKRRLENFGEINPMALEAYNEMKLRFDSIVIQRQDIFDAKTSLEATIKEIEETATVQFMEAFAQVQTHFKEVFQSLFSEGDDCDLVLSDPENPLDSMIEVIAKPKGKRPRTLSQLSGGEKALTAIALLFSLYLMKPAPFCVFDEVDAPLDDVNVIKFNKIIRKFSDRSQFVVITHNKLTMAEVDVLYGIYMEEKGVSNVSQVDFRSYEHELVLERT